MNRLDNWITELCAALDIDPALVDRDVILDLARDAAHGIARPAAPVTTFLVGFAAGRTNPTAGGIAEAARLATELANAHEPEPDTD